MLYYSNKFIYTHIIYLQIITSGFIVVIQVPRLGPLQLYKLDGYKWASSGSGT